MTSAITATGLRKSFGGKIVLDGIDLEVGAGTTFSLVPTAAARPPPRRSCPRWCTPTAARCVSRPGGGTGHDRGHPGSAEISTGSGKV
jgi:ABC-2 type transport system ATP-binding protein